MGLDDNLVATNTRVNFSIHLAIAAWFAEWQALHTYSMLRMPLKPQPIKGNTPRRFPRICGLQPAACVAARKPH